MFKFESLTHRYTMYFWWIFSDLSHNGMDPQCMFGGHDLYYLTWIFSCQHLLFESLYSEYGNAYLSDDILLYCISLFVGRFSTDVFLVLYTHSTKYISYHSILT
jgi:hypothetical protein